jgi:hypothetical protein
MAMKLRHPGVDVKTSLEALALVERSFSDHHNVKIFEARIVSDEMIVCGQHWLLIPAGQVLKLSGDAYHAPEVSAHLNSSVDY